MAVYKLSTSTPPTKEKKSPKWNWEEEKLQKLIVSFNE
jgi:hypothetical protein